MTSWQRGHVVVVAFPYTEPAGQVVVKGRPALVVSGQWVHRHTADVLVAAISSRMPAARSLLELPIRSGTPAFRATGLRIDSVVKLATIAALPASMVSRRIGHLDSLTMRAVNRGLRRVFDLQ